MTGMRLQSCLSVFDAQGRFAPQFADEYTDLAADVVVFAIGQAPKLGPIVAGLGHPAHRARPAARSTARCSRPTSAASSRAARSSPVPARRSPRSRAVTRRPPRSTGSSRARASRRAARTGRPRLPALPAGVRRRRRVEPPARRRCRWPRARSARRTSARSNSASRISRGSPRPRAACAARRACAWGARSARARVPTTPSESNASTIPAVAASPATTSTSRSAASAVCAPSSARPVRCSTPVSTSCRSTRGTTRSSARTRWCAPARASVPPAPRCPRVPRSGAACRRASSLAADSAPANPEDALAEREVSVVSDFVSMALFWAARRLSPSSARSRSCSSREVMRMALGLGRVPARARRALRLLRFRVPRAGRAVRLRGRRAHPHPLRDHARASHGRGSHRARRCATPAVPRAAAALRLADCSSGCCSGVVAELGRSRSPRRPQPSWPQLLLGPLLPQFEIAGALLLVALVAVVRRERR